MEPKTPKIRPMIVNKGIFSHLNVSMYLPAKVQITMKAAICNPRAEYFA